MGANKIFETVKGKVPRKKLRDIHNQAKCKKGPKDVIPTPVSTEAGAGNNFPNHLADGPDFMVSPSTREGYVHPWIREGNMAG